MKKYFHWIKFLNWITVPLALFVFIIYAGNILVIGEHIGRIIPYEKINNYVVNIWDISLIVLPFVWVGFYIYKNVHSYKEVRVSNILNERNAGKLTTHLYKILSQENTPNSMLSKKGYREKCMKAAKSVNREEKQETLEIYYKSCKKEADIITKKYALYAAASVVLSPKMAGDTLALIIWEIRIINTILQIYGGRPGICATLRIYHKILFHAFMAGSIDEIFDQFIYGAVEGKTLSYLTQAVAAIATCLRTSMLTQYYLWYGVESESKQALHEAVNTLPTEIINVILSSEFRDVAMKSWKCCITISKEAGKNLISLIYNDEDKIDDSLYIKANAINKT